MWKQRESKELKLKHLVPVEPRKTLPALTRDQVTQTAQRLSSEEDVSPVGWGVRQPPLTDTRSSKISHLWQSLAFPGVGWRLIPARATRAQAWQIYAITTLREVVGESCSHCKTQKIQELRDTLWLQKEQPSAVWRNVTHRVPLIWTSGLIPRDHHTLPGNVGALLLWHSGTPRTALASVHGYSH